jgi:hypothetical protein
MESGLPGEIHKDCSLTLIAATEPWHTVMALEPDAALTFECERRRRLVALAGDLGRCGVAAELILAADAFVITPAGRIADAARARRRRRNTYCDCRIPLVQ